MQKDEEEYKQHLEIQRQIEDRSKDSILHEYDRGIGHNIHHQNRGGDPNKVAENERFGHRKFAQSERQ